MAAEEARQYSAPAEVVDAKQQIDSIFRETAEKLIEENAIVIMPSFYPQEGAVLQELAEFGVQTHIYGPGGQLFPRVPHTTVSGVASNVDSETPENIQRIIDAVDLEELRGKKIYLYQFMHYDWRKLLQERIDQYNLDNPENQLDCYIMGDMTIGNEPQLEGKHQLPSTLEAAGLHDYRIPGETYNLSQFANWSPDETKIREVFRIQDGNPTGKIVVQFCGEGYQEVGGGQGTIIFDNYEEFRLSLEYLRNPNPIEEAKLDKNSKIGKFLKIARENRDNPGVSLKVSKYIQGIEGNLSFVVLPPAGARDLKFGPNDTPETMRAIMQGTGINPNATVVIPGRMTLKCVGDPRLTTKSGSGVGNDLGYFHGPTVNGALSEISECLGKYVASLGFWGLMGCDIKVTPAGETYIIEINSRQQGPTAGMSQDAEVKGAPSIIKMQTIFAFGTAEQIEKMRSLLVGKEAAIVEAYMSQGGSFYVKFANTDRDAVASRELKPGHYSLELGEGGRWHWVLDTPIQANEARILMGRNSLKAGHVVLGLKGHFGEGKPFGLDEQMFKIEGSSRENFPGPFTTNEDRTKVVLREEFWAQALKSLRLEVTTIRSAHTLVDRAIGEPFAPVTAAAGTPFIGGSSDADEATAKAASRTGLSKAADQEVQREGTCIDALPAKGKHVGDLEASAPVFLTVGPQQ